MNDKFFVAQVSNLLYRAIQQIGNIGNLRYALVPQLSPTPQSKQYAEEIRFYHGWKRIEK